ncbi:CRISPR-associated endonuclease Cas2 [Companilactobacillus keshanensis]|uniref:CRISPR-associated endoribonuclease Cas2 n=1 Tax=Companilactobacillus keshanensis TaxID=2486003 RepID=A0ABW4BX40_9LACO|nr:CRISPR-associated endonuclease Cas2 [Companilactobacillus keshanensis]
MRMMCLFDLPMDTPKQQRQYRIFRKELIRNGFMMLQYSVYYRSIPNRSAGKKYQNAIEYFLPENGEIRLMAVSEKQFEDMQVLVGSKSKQETIVGNKNLVII